FRDVLFLLGIVAIVKDRQRADTRMGRKGNSERMARADYIRDEHGRIKILSKPPVGFWNGNAQQAQLTGLIEQAFHKSFLLCIDALQVGKNLCFQEIVTGLPDHHLFLVEFLGDEHILKGRFTDDEFTPFYRCFCVRVHLNLVMRYKISKMPAAPWPVPTHIVTMPYRWFRRFISWNSCTDNLAPEQPNGCPNAMAPPFTFKISGLMPSSRMTAKIGRAHV